MMSEIKYKHEKILHYYLTHRYLSEEAYKILTELKQHEIDSLLSFSKTKIMNITNKLILIVKYQQAKLMKKHQEWIFYRNKISKYDCLYADAAQFVIIPKGFTEKELAIKLLSCVDSRKSIIWGLRLDIRIPDCQIIMKRPECINFIINKMIDG